jgi:hypothetical protein
MTINERLEILEKEVIALKTKNSDLSANTEEKFSKPTTQVGGVRSSAFNFPVDTKTGMGGMFGNGVIWNNSELSIPRIDQEAPIPTKGYNKHSHSRFSGGALIKNVIEVVEYNATDWALITNPHSQQYWTTTPNYAKELNSNTVQVEKIGKLDLVFNPDTLTWGTPAYEIDVQKCYFVKRRTTAGSVGEEVGTIEKDSKGNEKKSYLYIENSGTQDLNQSSIVWDENANNGNGGWRLLAVYAPGEQE